MNDEKMDYLCSCGSSFKSKSSFYRHRKGCWTFSNRNDAYVCNEPNCSFRASSSGEFLRHLNEAHKIASEEKIEEFNDYKDFLTWKEDFERKTKSFFRVKRKQQTAKGRTDYFDCNRSGSYSPKTDRVRAIKSHGIRKIGFKCPATMKASVDAETGRVRVVVQTLHHGHSSELAHLPIPKSDKCLIAGQLSIGVSPSQVICDMFSTPSADVERRHLVTGKDVWNISRAYGIDQPASKDRFSINQPASKDHFGIDQPASTDHFDTNLPASKDHFGINPSFLREYVDDVLLYKQQGEEQLSIPWSSSGTLRKKDFALGLMTHSQRELWERFGGGNVCIDATPFRDFHLTTVLVSDQCGEGITVSGEGIPVSGEEIPVSGEGIPVAFLLSNGENSSVLSLFFEEVRKRGDACPGTVTSVPRYFKSWELAFGSGTRKLLCDWYVRREWTRNIRKKIGDELTANAVYKDLCTVLEESDRAKFEILLWKCMEQIRENPQTAEFWQYFDREWCQITTQWAKCYRATNVSLELFHEVLKLGHLGRIESGNGVDQCLPILVQISRDVAANSKINEHHKKAVAMLPKTLVKQTTQTTWCVDSGTSDLVYRVTKQPECKLECRIKCRPCGICRHAYRCDCPEGSTGICEHIHLAVQKEKSFDPSSDNSRIASNNEPPCIKSAFIIKFVNNREERVNESTEVLKSNLLKKQKELMKMIKNCNDRDAISAARDHINRAYDAIKMLNCAIPADTANNIVTAPDKTKGKQYRFLLPKY